MYVYRSGTGTAACSSTFVMIPDGRETVVSLREEKLLFPRRQPTRKPVAVTKRKLQVPSSQDRFCGGHFAPKTGETVNKPVFGKSTTIFLAQLL